MTDDNEILLRYHFGDLPAEEVLALEARLLAEAPLQAQLEELRQCLATHADPCDCIEPKQAGSPCLVERTVQAVLAGPCERATLSPPPETSCSRFGLVETFALGAAALLLVSLGLPALQSARESSRRTSCELGLASVYQSLDLYGREHRSHFPMIGHDENAGLFTVSLAEGGYASRDELRRLTVCPSSELAQQVAQGAASVTIPTRRQLASASPDLIRAMRRLMAGSLAYRIGYYEGETYVGPDNAMACRSTVLADAPQLDAAGQVVLRSHGACGQNVLFRDGHVEFVEGCWASASEDHLFLNDAGKVAAGLGPRDAVLAPSEATPSGVWFVKFGR